MHLEVDSLRVRRAPIRLKAINEAKPLEPEAPAYGYTYEKLLEEFLPTIAEGEAKHARYALNEWLYFVDKTPRHVVGAELTAGFDETLTSFSNALGTKVADKTVRNIRGRIKAVQSFYLACLEKEAIPEGFREALQFGMDRMGLTPGRLIRLVGQTAYKWARGDSSPDPRHKDRCGTNMKRLEELLHFPPGTLALRAWPAGNKVAELSDDVPHRRYLTLIQRYEYRLPIEQMPKPLQASIATYVEHKKQQTHMLPTGEVVTLPLTEIWSSEATCYNSLQLLGFYFGFLRLPKAVDPRTPWPESLQYGMGIQDEALRFTMLVNKDLLFQYMRYAEQRTFDRLHFAQYEANQAANASGASVMSHSGAGLRKTLSAAFLRFIGLCVNLVNKPTGFLRMHPEFGQELPTPVPAKAKEKVSQQFADHRALRQAMRAPAQLGLQFARIPQLCLKLDGYLEVVERDTLADLGEWNLLDFPVQLAGFAIQEMVNSFEIDVRADKVKVRAVGALQMRLDEVASHVSEQDLIRWLDQEVRKPYLSQLQLQAYLTKMLAHLIHDRGFSLTALVRARFQLSQAISAEVERLRKLAIEKGFQGRLFEMSVPTLEEMAQYSFAFEAGKYPARNLYQGSYEFQKHFYPVIHDLREKTPAGKTAEEFRCAMAIDANPKVKHWVRNIERQENSSFWLPTSTDYFYPDFVAELEDGRVLVVEYKGEVYSTNDDSREKKQVGHQWEKSSGGRCLFLFATERDEQGRDVAKQLADKICS